MASGKLVILSAPSGAGKTTIMKHLLKAFPTLEFSVSATSRGPRAGEAHGVDYYFMTSDEFLRNIEAGAFVEWEEVYAGTHYGTLRSEMERIWDKGNAIVFDVDVKGGLRLKQIFGDRALAIFVMPPSLDELRNRLESRGTDSAENIDRRVAKASLEMEEAPYFDFVILNERLEEAVVEAVARIKDFLS